MSNTNQAQVVDALRGAARKWTPPVLPEKIPQGDMPGDKIQIGMGHVEKAQVIFPHLCGLLTDVCAQNPYGRAVVTVCGGSGVGKSEAASLLAFYLRTAGVGAYTLSGDNYPHRIPMYNDAERQRVFRTGGVKGLVAGGLYSAQHAEVLRALWEKETDAAPEQAVQHPWLAAYQAEGRKALAGYLGTPREQDFDALSNIVSQFKNGADGIWLKRMGRTEAELWYDKVDFFGVSVLVIEWTHGNSDYYTGVDIPVLLNSTPQETAEHRRQRGRDGKVDSPFTTMVLELEQRLLESQAHKAKLIISKDGALLDYAQYRALMARQ